MESHLLQMRGLKRFWTPGKIVEWDVASFTDAWIETDDYKNKCNNNQCRIFYRCVD